MMTTEDSKQTELINVPISADGIRIIHRAHSEEVGHAYLYVLKNDLHERPFGFMEDVFVNEGHRNEGLGKSLVRTVIAEAKRRNCYKLVATSRTERDQVHSFYEHLGFTDHGKEFRITF